MAEDKQGTDTPTTAPINVPDKPALEGLEAALTQRWLDEGTYKFNPDTTREQVYSIDTPPPTASGSLHVGHMFSYTQTDVLARYQRMTGKNVFYPMGWDDNGLPTERRVQNYYGVRCDPSIAYDAGYRPPAEPAKNQRDFDVISRRNFIELCEELAVEDEKVFEHLFQTLGLSVDWNLTYRTIDDKSRAISQRAFLANLSAGDAYMAEAPTLWDVTFRTAVAQAELEDREVAGAYYRYPFFTAEGEKIFIETTRPELLAACAALVANPDDERYQPLFGKKVTSPLFGVEVEVKAHPLAKADKGSGIAMVCTFGDLTDVTWWRELQLPTRAIVGRDGRIVGETPEWITTEEGRASFAAIAGKTVFSAKEAVVELLAAADLLDGEPKKIMHPVNFFEKGDKPLEVVTSRQWYIRNGGRDEDRRERLIGRGNDIEFHPAFMRSRYENWISGLNGDWLVSRQRFFGVPVPVWYPLDADGNPDYDAPILPVGRAAPRGPGRRRRARLRGSPARCAGRLHRRRGRPGHLGHVLADPADRGRLEHRRGALRQGLPLRRAPAGARHHPDLALLLRRPRRRAAKDRAVEARRHFRLDPGPGPEEDVQVQGQRDCSHGRAGRVRLRRRALLGGLGPARCGHRLRDRADEDRPPPGHQAAQRLQVRPEPGRHRGFGRFRRPVGADQPLGPGRAGPARRRRPAGHQGVRELRLRPGPADHRELLLELHR